MQVPVLAFHHSPKIYRNPEAFVPERWIEGTPEYAQDSQVQGKWMPFGDGTRVCVGQRLALMEAKVALAHVFRRWGLPHGFSRQTCALIACTCDGLSQFASLAHCLMSTRMSGSACPDQAAKVSIIAIYNEEGRCCEWWHHAARAQETAARMQGRGLTPSRVQCDASLACRSTFKLTLGQFLLYMYSYIADAQKLNKEWHAHAGFHSS